MNSAHQLARCTLPSQIDEPKTGKHRLWNAVLSFLTEKGCVWRGSEVESSRESLLRAYGWILFGLLMTIMIHSGQEAMLFQQF